MIDDDNDLLAVTKVLLQKKGFQIEACSDWEKAKEKIRTFKPHLVLLDIFLKKSDGLQICNILKASPFTRHIPILILSGYPRLAESAIYEFGADDFISKPFEINDIVSKMHHILSRRHFTA